MRIPRHDGLLQPVNSYMNKKSELYRLQMIQGYNVIQHSLYRYSHPCFSITHSSPNRLPSVAANSLGLPVSTTRP